MFASVATYPHEVLRTRLQIQKFARDNLISEINLAEKATFSSSKSTHRMNAGEVMGEVKKVKGYEGIGVTFKKILREEGYRGFYRGMGVNLVRTVPSSALTILSYVHRIALLFAVRRLTFVALQIRSDHASIAGAQSSRAVPLVRRCARLAPISSRFRSDPESPATPRRRRRRLARHLSTLPRSSFRQFLSPS